MTFEVSLGWWLVPLALTILAWLPMVRYEKSHSNHIIDVAGAFVMLGAVAATSFVWMVYFAIGWAVS